MNIKEARKYRHMTQTVLAEKINDAQSHISQIEKNMVCTVRTLKKIAKVLDMRLIIELVPREDADC